VRGDSESARTGGVLVYIDERIRFEIKAIEKCEGNWWSIIVYIEDKNCKGIVMVVYHSPNSSDSKFLDYLDNTCNEVILRQNVIIMGDFNIDLKRDNYIQRKLINNMYSVGLKQLVNDVTRIVRTSETKIDLVFSNKEIEVEVRHEPKITDHSMIIVNQKGKLDRETDKKMVRRDYKRMNIVRFMALVGSELGKVEEDGINEMANGAVIAIVKCLDIVAPRKEILIRKKWQGKSWFSDEIYRQMQQRDMTYRAARISKCWEDWEKYRQTRNKTVDMCRKAKREYLKERLDDSKNDPKQMWKVLKEILKGKDSGKEYRELKYNNVTICSREEMADVFNKYFVESVTQLRKEEWIENDLDHVQYTDSTMEVFQKIEDESVKSIVRKLPNKSGTEEGITVEVMKFIVEVAGQKIAHIFNKSLEQGIFPDEWKESIVVPIPKIGGTIKIEEFRPINKLPVYEKVLEILARKQLVEYLDKNELFSESQSGFRAKHSCETALQWVISSWKKTIGERKMLGVIFLDLKRAFEVVDREILLKKLKAYGIKGTVLKWFMSYLINRTQRVKFNGVLSRPISVDLGVPQGSVLGPLLFLLYINDIAEIINDNCAVRLFADDALIYTTGFSSQEISDNLNKQMVKVEKWLDLNRLVVNVNKTKVMLIRGVRKKVNESNVVIKLKGKVLEMVNEIKYLGIIIDKNLNFSANAEYISRKAGAKLGVLRRVSEDMSRDIRCKIYKTIVAPLFEYCASILVGLNETNVKRLQKLQNQAMRIILRRDRKERIMNMLETLKFMSIKERIEYNVCLLIYKIVKEMCPKYLSRDVEMVQTRSNRDTRKGKNLCIARCRTREEQKMLLHDGFQMYNDLPSEVKDVQTLKGFKRALVKHIMGREREV